MVATRNFLLFLSNLCFFVILYPFKIIKYHDFGTLLLFCTLFIKALLKLSFIFVYMQNDNIHHLLCAKSAIYKETILRGKEKII